MMMHMWTLGKRLCAGTYCEKCPCMNDPKTLSKFALENMLAISWLYEEASVLYSAQQCWLSLPADPLGQTTV